MRSLLAILVAGGLLLPPAATAGPLPIPTANPDVVPSAAQEAQGCDPIDPSLCLLPFPNDFFTVADPTTATGRRVQFSPTAMPRNGTDVTTGEAGGEGKPIDPTEWNRNDGFSPGTPVITFVPGLDLHVTWATQGRAHSAAGPNQPGYFDHRDQITDVALSLDPEAPLEQVPAGPDDQCDVLRVVWIRVDLGPDQVPRQRLRVDHDDRLPGPERLLHVVDRDDAGPLERGLRL